MMQPVVIELYERKLGNPKQRYRWRAKSAFNGRKLANGGEGYSTKDARAEALDRLWPDQSHISVVDV